ncbi:LytR family transcriptional regulator [Streptococcus hillyeri]|uniref:LytR family transcriptional regulator n=1 Tax=Streptococcus hillyeri TaxID=2282420 RepID=A0A3L9DWX1_9STRE|nr:LytR family transcriptional regulator [Streptococcus hillyeri]RLY04453.1 LytR family transcriptional regulator [Streptococcus hillyeri]
MTKDTLTVLLDLYAYHQAWKIAEQSKLLSSEAHFLLEMLKERRELNVDYLFEHEKDLRQLEERYQLRLLSNAYEEELLANYMMDLEAKVKNADIIDFVRAVSPILYRLFLRLAQQKVPDLKQFIHDTKSDQYDSWKFGEMVNSTNPFVQAFVSERRDSKVTSKSLADLIEVTDFSKAIKDTVAQLRQLEKAVRNPLAHLIKPFDEEELHRTTKFSSQIFLEKIIFLAQEAGVIYDTKDFYYDKVNQLIKAQLL